MTAMRILMCSLIVAAHCSAQGNPVARLPEDAREVIRKSIQNFLQRTATAGIAIALTDRGGLIYTATDGFADAEKRSPVTDDTLFPIASISKSFTAVAVLQNHDAGNIELHQPFARYLPWVEIRSSHPFTVYDVLTHTAGLPRNSPGKLPLPFGALALRDTSTLFEPGSGFLYSNLGYQILGFALQRITGRPFQAVIREQILDPLEMRNSSPALVNEIQAKTAVSYEFPDDRTFDREESLVRIPWTEYGFGDGSVAASAPDLASFLRMLLNRGSGPKRRILSEESFSLMIRPPVLPGGSRTRYGCGITVEQINGHTIISHDGNGGETIMKGDLGDGIGVVILRNTRTQASVAPLADYALDVIRAAIHRETIPAPPPGMIPAAPPGRSALTRITNAGDYAGEYTSAEGGKLQFVAEGDRLALLYGSEKIALERRRPDMFFVRHPDFALYQMGFERTGKAVSSVFYGGDWYQKGAAKPPAPEYPAEWRGYPGQYRTADASSRSFRIVLRQGMLILVGPLSETMLSPDGQGRFRVGDAKNGAEIRFDSMVEGQAQRATLSGFEYYKTFRQDAALGIR